MSNILEWSFNKITKQDISLEKNITIPGNVVDNNATFVWKLIGDENQVDYYMIKKDNNDWERKADNNIAYVWSNIIKGLHELSVRAIDINGKESNIIKWSFNKEETGINDNIVGDKNKLEKMNNPIGDIASDIQTFKFKYKTEEHIKRYEVQRNDGSWEWVPDLKVGEYQWTDIPRGHNILHVKTILNDDTESNEIEFDFYNGVRLYCTYYTSGYSHHNKSWTISKESYSDENINKTFSYHQMKKDIIPTLDELKTDSINGTIDAGIAYTVIDEYMYAWAYDNNNRITNILQINLKFSAPENWNGRQSVKITNNYKPPKESTKPVNQNIELTKSNNPTNDIGVDSYKFEYTANHYDKIKRLEVKKNTNNWEWVDFEFVLRDGSYVTPTGQIVSSSEFIPYFKWEDIPKGLNTLEIKAISNDDKESNILKWEFWNGTQLKIKHGRIQRSGQCGILVNQFAQNADTKPTIYYVEFDKDINPSMDDLNENKVIKKIDETFKTSNKNMYAYIWGIDKNNRMTNIIKDDLELNWVNKYGADPNHYGTWSGAFYAYSGYITNEYKPASTSTLKDQIKLTKNLDMLPGTIVENLHFNFGWKISDPGKNLKDFEVKLDSNEWIKVTRQGIDSTTGKNIMPVSGASQSTDGTIDIFKHTINDTSFEWRNITDGNHTFKIRAVSKIDGKYSNELEWVFKKESKFELLKDNELIAKTPKGTSFSWKLIGEKSILTHYEIKKDAGNWTKLEGKDLLLYVWENIELGDHIFYVRAKNKYDKYSNVLEWKFKKEITFELVKDDNIITGENSAEVKWSLTDPENTFIQYESKSNDGNWSKISETINNISYKWVNLPTIVNKLYIRAKNKYDKYSNELEWEFDNSVLGFKYKYVRWNTYDTNYRSSTMNKVYYSMVITGIFPSKLPEKTLEVYFVTLNKFDPTWEELKNASNIKNSALTTTKNSVDWLTTPEENKYLFIWGKDYWGKRTTVMRHNSLNFQSVWLKYDWGNAKWMTNEYLPSESDY